MNPAKHSDIRIRDDVALTPEGHHERRVVSVKALLLAVAILVASAIVVHLALAGLLAVFRQQNADANRHFSEPLVDRSLRKDLQRFPEPRLQIAPREDLRELRAREEAELGSYGWIDKTNGLVRIPIDRAMNLLVQRGLPVRGDDDTPRHISREQLQRNRAEQR
jgi:hypothetical protein